ncbi:hypothetical protein [Emticicia sp. W12TSBA100-4]|uniref:hypothetical protein n=1 Tax=Emticicia sp. W12TSBA100-4 TaxID=3160965 RepID=UPI0033063CC2
MTQIVLEIDNERDIRLFIDLAERLNVKFKERTEIVADKDIVNEAERKERRKNIQAFRGSLKRFKGYESSKSEFYEQ